MLDQCQYFTSEQSHHYLSQRKEKRTIPTQYRAKNRILSQLLGQIEIKPMPFEIMSISEMRNFSKNISESEILQDNMNLLNQQEKTQIPHLELYQKTKHCCNLLERSKEEIQDFRGLSILFEEILEILKQSTQKQVYFIKCHNLNDLNKQRRLIYNTQALSNLIKRLKSSKQQSQTKYLFGSRSQTLQQADQIQKTELSEQLGVEALNLLKKLKKKQLNA